MTYLQVVNRVLRLLREDEVISVSQTTYSKMIGDLVNQVKDDIEGAFNWNALKNTISVNTVNGTFRYVLTDSGSKSILLDAWNDTSDWQLKKVSSYWLNREFAISTITNDSPYAYGVNGSDSNGDLQVDVYPTPNGIYNLDFNLILKQAELSADADIPLIPNDVLVLGAWASAVSERGEDGGASFGEIDQKYRLSLADAIAIDSSNAHPSEASWYVV